MVERPNGWTAAPLGVLAEWLSGGTPKTAEPRYWKGEIPWITSGSLTSFYLRASDRRLTELGVRNGSRLVPKNSIIFVVRGMSLKSEFRIGIAARPVAFGQDCKALIARPGIEPMFLAQAIRGRSNEVLAMVDEAGHGTGRLATDRIKALNILLPPLVEQQAIAEVLGALDDKIECNATLRGSLRSFGQALFEQAVESAAIETSIGELTVSLARGVAPRYTAPGLGVPVLNQKCIRDGWVLTEAARWMEDLPVKDSKRAHAGDVVVNSTGVGTLGRVARWLGPNPVIVDGHVTVVRPDDSQYPSTEVISPKTDRTSGL